MPNWQPFRKIPFRRGGRKTLATLSADVRRPTLLIGALLKEKGFDVWILALEIKKPDA
jgi:hypothetical protein